MSGVYVAAVDFDPMCIVLGSRLASVLKATKSRSFDQVSQLFHAILRMPLEPGCQVNGMTVASSSDLQDQPSNRLATTSRSNAHSSYVSPFSSLLPSEPPLMPLAPSPTTSHHLHDERIHRPLRQLNRAHGDPSFHAAKASRRRCRARAARRVSRVALPFGRRERTGHERKLTGMSTSLASASSAATANQRRAVIELD